MKYAAPAVVQLTPKYGLRDCVVSALSAYLGRPYEEVVAAAGKVYPYFWRTGLENKHAVRVARRLGRRVQFVRDFDIDEDSGVLTLGYNVGRNEHAVLLLEGRILELEDKPINSWEPSAYLTAHNARAGLLLVEVKR
jgi:hypothetical protein